jgi:hypothetical protein
VVSMTYSYGRILGFLDSKGDEITLTKYVNKQHCSPGVVGPADTSGVSSADGKWKLTKVMQSN